MTATRRPSSRANREIPDPLVTQTSDQTTVSLTVPMHSMARSATVIGLAFIVSRVLGLLREVILAYQFGTSGELDAYISAFRVPDLLFLTVIAGAFGSAFIPVFAGFLGRGDQRRAWDLASAVLNLTAVVILAAAVVCFALAGPIMRYLVAPGLAPEYQELAADTMRLLLLSPILLGLGIAAKGILEAHHRFDLPALSPVIYNLGIIAGALMLGPSLGVVGVAIGVIVGAFGHFLVQVPGLLRVGMRYRPGLNLRVDGLAEVGRLLAPRVIGQAAFQVNFIVVNAFASSVSEARVSALNYAWQLMMLPHGVLALSISTVIFPTMAQLYDQGRLDELKATLSGALRPLLFLTLPAAVGLFAFRVPIVQTVFQGGAFSAESTRLVAPALAFFALGLTGYAVVEVMTRTYYAMRDTWTPVATALLIITANVVLCALFVGPMGHTGLTLSLSATTAAEAIILLLVLRHRTGGLDAGLPAWFGRVLLAAAVMGVVTLLMAGPLTDATRPGVTPRLAQLVVLFFAIGVGAGVYALASYWLRVPELHSILGRVVGLRRRR